MALLKAGIINCERKRPQEKMLRFMEFLNNNLGCLLSREAIIAALHFRGKAGSLIPITPGTKVDVRKRIMASAWDVMLLRMPEFFLANGDQQETTVGYVCTSDSALQQVGSMFTLLRVRCFADEQFTIYPEFVFHHDVLVRLLGSDITEVLSQSYDPSRIAGQRRTIPDKAMLQKLQFWRKKQSPSARGDGDLSFGTTETLVATAESHPPDGRPGPSGSLSADTTLQIGCPAVPCPASR